MAAYKKKTREEIQEEVTKLTELGINQIKKFEISNEDRLEMLDFMSKFYHYSEGNQAKIQAQYPGAYGVGSFKFFADQGLSLKGQKSIRILAPSPKSFFRDVRGKLRPLKEATKLEKAMI